MFVNATIQHYMQRNISVIMLFQIKWFTALRRGHTEEHQTDMTEEI